MSVSRAAFARIKPNLSGNGDASGPLLIVSFELNKPTRPKMAIYENSDVPSLIDEFVRQHRLKSTAVAIISKVINENMAEMREEERLRAKSSRNNFKREPNRRADRHREQNK